MILTEQDIPRLNYAAEEFIENHPEGEKLRDAVDIMGSGEETLCLMTLDELEGNGTVCGSGEPGCFDKDVIAFLRSQGVESVLVGVTTEDTDVPLIAGGAVPIPFYGTTVDDWRDWFPEGNQYLSERAADCAAISPSAVLSEMISERGGSWRDDDCIEGWSSYESE
jgi:hypothetical protein